MSVPAYLAGLAVKNPSDHRLAKIKRLCDAVGLADKVSRSARAARTKWSPSSCISASRATTPICT